MWTHFVLLLITTGLISANANLDGLVKSVQEVNEKIQILEEQTDAIANKIEPVEQRTANFETFLQSMKSEISKQGETGSSRWEKMETEIKSLHDKIEPVDQSNKDIKGLVISMESKILAQLEMQSTNFEVKWEQHQINLLPLQINDSIRRSENIETLLSSINSELSEQTDTTSSHWRKVETEIASVNKNIKAAQQINRNIDNHVLSTRSEILKQLEEKSNNFEMKLGQHQLNTTAVFADLNAQMHVSMQRLENLDAVVVTTMPKLSDSLLNLTQSVEYIRSDIVTRQLETSRTLALASGQCYNPSGNTRIEDCSDIIPYNAGAGSGVYHIFPIPGLPTKVYCDVDGDQAWTVIQRRGAPLPASGERVDFFRGWDSYENEFGSIDSDYWLGLRNIQALTKNIDTELLIHMTHWNGTYAWAKYKTFRVGSSLDNYRLYVGEYSGTAGDSLTYSNNMAFSTKDKDNDLHSSVHCANHTQGAWWYSTWSLANLNGPYGADDPTRRVFSDYKGIYWYTFTGYNNSLKSVRMQIRRAS